MRRKHKDIAKGNRPIFFLTQIHVGKKVFRGCVYVYVLQS